MKKTPFGNCMEDAVFPDGDIFLLKSGPIDTKIEKIE